MCICYFIYVEYVSENNISISPDLTRTAMNDEGWDKTHTGWLPLDELRILKKQLNNNSSL